MPALSSDAALLLLTLGFLLLYLELNRPGLVLPGALGLTIFLLAISRFVHAGLQPGAASAFVVALILLVVSTRTRSCVLPSILATSCLLYAFLRPSLSERPDGWLAVACALVLGVGTSLLTTIAARARQNKGLDLK